MVKGDTMQTIIQNKLSEMLDELLQKVLEEKPKIIYEDTINYYHVELILKDNRVLLHLNYMNDCIYAGHINILLTPHQKELINKVFEKWGKDNERNN